MNPVPIGILSTAHIHAGGYAHHLQQANDAVLVGVADDDAERGRAFAEAHDTTYFDPAALLDQVEGGIVCATNADHTGWISRAANAGVVVLCEKPLAPTVEDARRIADLCADAGVDLGVAMPLRFSEPVRVAKSRFDDGTIGDLRSITGTNRGQMPGGWFADPAAAGGGATMDHTVHVVDLVHWLTGERVSEVFAETATRFHDIPVEDVNLLSMKLTDGTSFSLDGSWSRPDEWDFWGDATVDLVGTEGVITVDCFDQVLKQTRGSGTDPGIHSVFWGTDPNEGLVQDFTQSVRTERHPAASPADAIDAISVVEAAYRSAAENRPVPVDQ